MVEFPKIPTRIYYSGDSAKAKNLVGLGRKRFSDLTTASGFQNLPTGFNTLEMSDGSIIKTSQSYGVSKIEIYVPPVPIEPEEECEAECLCGCGIQTGCVVESPFSEYNLLTGLWEHDLELIPQADDLYGIRVCLKPFALREIEDSMHSLDFFPHKAGPLKFDKYFVVAEAYEAGQPQDISAINACTWGYFHLISLQYEDTIERCM